MINPKDLSKRLFSEKSLFDIVTTFESAFSNPLPCKRFAIVTLLFTAAMSAQYYSTTSPLIPEDIQKMSQGLVEFGVVLSTALLGVAIAGFSIFASSLDAKVVEKLALTDYRKDGPNHLSFIFSLFIYVLLSLFLLLGTSLVFITLLSEPSLLNKSFVTPIFSIKWQVVIQLAYLCLYLSQLSFVFSILYSFIWNLHQILMVIAAARIMELQSQNKEP